MKSFISYNAWHRSTLAGVLTDLYSLTVADLRKDEEMRAGQREVRRYSVMGLMTTYLITLLGKLGLIRSAVVIKI